MKKTITLLVIFKDGERKVFDNAGSTFFDNEKFLRIEDGNEHVGYIPLDCVQFFGNIELWNQEDQMFVESDEDNYIL